MARHGDPAAARQQAELVVEPGGDLVDRQDPGPGGGQLERERDPVEPADELGDCGGVVAADPEPWANGRGPLDEQGHGLGPADRRGGRRGLGQRQGRDRVERLAGDAEALPAGGHDPDVGAGGEDPVDGGRRRLEDVLAVVEDEQPAARPEVVEDGRRDVLARLLGDRHGRRDRLEDEGTVLDRAELDEPGPLVVLVEVLGREAQSEARLADTTRADERQERGRGQDRAGRL